MRPFITCTTFIWCKIVQQERKFDLSILLVARLACRGLAGMPAIQVVARHVCPIGSGASCLPYRQWRGMSALQVVAHHVCPTGSGASCLPYRQWRGMSALQVVALQTCRITNCRRATTYRAVMPRRILKFFKSFCSCYTILRRKNVIKVSNESYKISLQYCTQGSTTMSLCGHSL